MSDLMEVVRPDTGEMLDVPLGWCACGCGTKTRVATKTDRGAGQVKGQPLRFVSGHNFRILQVDAVERFWSNVEKTDGCWNWKGSLVASGYGRIRVGGKADGAHRFSYELHGGVIPDGLEIDHLCRNRGCVNPAHLEVVTKAENVLRGIGRSAENARKTHCKRGHLLDGDNCLITPRGHRVCRTCKRDWARNDYRRKVAA